MATIYITEETREKLDVLTTTEKRTISDEIDFLVELRIKELSNYTDTEQKSQE